MTERINPRGNGNVLDVQGKAKDSLENNDTNKSSRREQEELTSLQGGGTKVKLSIRHVYFEGTTRAVQ